MISDLTYRAVWVSVFLFLFSDFAEAQRASTEPDDSVTIADVQFHGLKKTKPVTLEREMQVHKGMKYDSAGLQAATERSIAMLKNLNLFNEIHVHFEAVSDTLSQVQVCHVHVIEKWYVWPLPFVEFADRNFNQWWKFDFDPQRTNFGLYLFKYNFRGRNQTVKLSLVTGYTDNLGIAYNVPFTSWNNKFGYYIETLYRTNREVWYKTSENRLQFLSDPGKIMIRRQLNAGSLYYRFSPTTTVYFDLGYGKISVNDTVIKPEQNPEFLADRATVQHQYSAGLSIVREARNNRLFPWSGHYLSLISSSTMINNSKTMLHYLGGKAAVYLPFSRRWSLAGSGTFKLSSLKDAPYYNFKSFGYSSYVRGYENFVVEGQHFVLFKSGLRFAIWNEKEHHVQRIPFRQYQHLPMSVYLDAFTDAGYVVNHSGNTGNDLQNSWLVGTGIGLNMAFYFDKVIRFEVTRNRLDQYGVFIHFEKSM